MKLVNRHRKIYDTEPKKNQPQAQTEPTAVGTSKPEATLGKREREDPQAQNPMRQVLQWVNQNLRKASSKGKDTAASKEATAEAARLKSEDAKFNEKYRDIKRAQDARRSALNSDSSHDINRSKNIR